MADRTPRSDDPASTGTSSTEDSWATDSQTVGTVRGQRSLQEEMKYWSECIRQWFPDLLNTTYFVPPVHLNRVPYDVTPMAGLMVKDPTDGVGTSQGRSGQPVAKGRRVKRKIRSGQAANHEPGKGTLLQTSYQSQLNTLQQSSPFSSTQQTSQVNTVQQTSQISITQQTSQELSTWQFDKYSMWPPTDFSMGLPGPVLDRDVRHDRAMIHLLGRFQDMANTQHEVMIVMTEYKFSNYLNTLTTDIASQLPRPSDHGDFDLLIVHKEYGLLVGEMKCVGVNRKALGISVQDFERTVGNKIVKAVRQVKKASDVVQHLVSDIAPVMTCHASVILPFVTTNELRQFLQADREWVKIEVCQCLALPDTTDVAELFICADQLSSVSALSGWWQGWKRRNGVHRLMSDHLYQQIVSRFVGPASTVEIHCVTPPRVELRTPGEGVAETGGRMTRLVLTPDQVDLLTRRPPKAFITGPPGTGKTVVLVLMALEWLRDGHDVYVVSLYPESRAASHLIQHQLQRSLEPNVSSTPGTIHRHQFDDDDDDMDSTVNTLSSFADSNGHLFVILDEVPEYVGKIGENEFYSFCDQLVVRVPHLHLWAASMNHMNRPFVLQEEKLTTALRCPPVIIQQLRQANFIDQEKSVYSYSHKKIPAPTHGPPILHLIHSGDGQDGHTTTTYVLECEQCGTKVAGVLKDLNVGRPPCSSSSTTDNNISSPLRYSEVFVLCQYTIRRDVGFVQGLLKAGLPVQVVNDDVDVRDVALGLNNRVTVAPYTGVQGLERKVVVALMNKYHKWFDQLFAASRCTSQFILVEVDSKD